MSDIKFTQIAVSDTEDGSTIMALGDDGNVYEYTGEGWFRLANDQYRSSEPAEEKEPEEEDEEEEEEDDEDDK